MGLGRVMNNIITRSSSKLMESNYIHLPRKRTERTEQFVRVKEVSDYRGSNIPYSRKLTELEINARIN